VPLDELLTSAHLVSVHIPATLDGRPLLGARELATMRRGAYLVNTARGALVDQSALLSAVETGALAGAALDVLGTEPPTDTRLFADDRIIVTPHSAWYSEEAFRMLKDEVAYELVRVLDGEPPRSPVNDVRTATRRA
jgi:phosphoglycerate dehydrogenase-like enzyme